MRVYLLLAEDPYYTESFVENILLKSNCQIVGAGFPSGFINFKRILKTFFIYGIIKFIKVSFYVLYHDLKGGKVKNLLRRKNIPVKLIKNVNSNSFRQYLTELDIDLIVSNNCPQLLKKDLLDIPKKGSINLHLGKLPYYRGVYPIFHAIVNNESHFGVTVHFMNVKFDDGPIINQKIIPIEKRDSLFDLYPRAFKLGSTLILSAINQIKSGDISTVKNGENGKSYFSYPNFSDIIKYRLRNLRSFFTF